MSALLIPLTLASVFVAGCLAIRALEDWAELVTAALAWIYGVVVILLAAAVIPYYVPRRPAGGSLTWSPSRDAPYQTTSSKGQRRGAMRASSSGERASRQD